MRCRRRTEHGIATCAPEFFVGMPIRAAVRLSSTASATVRVVSE